MAQNVFLMHAVLAAATAVLTVTVAQEVAVVRGLVTDVSGNPLPGAQVTLDGKDPSKPILADALGMFEITGVPSGSHVVHVALPGFRTQTRTVTLRAGQVSPSLRLVLPLATLIEAIIPLPDPLDALRRARAIAYVRLEGLMPPLPCSDLTVVSHLHSATVLETWKGKLPRKIQLFEPGVGSCLEGDKSVMALSGLSSRYATGGEFVVLLSGQGPRFAGLGQGSYVFAVHDGSVATDGFLGLDDKMPIRQFERRLRELAR